MSTFDDREKSFEKKFAHDEALQFKINARKNKYLGQWVSQILGHDSEKEKEYILDNTIGRIEVVDPIRGNNVFCTGKIAEELR